MALDGFLELKRQGVAAVQGECRDRTFAVKKAMSIKSFEFGTELAPAAPPDEDDDQDDDDDERPRRQAPKRSKPAAPPKNPTEFKFSVTKEVDSATPQLFVAYCQHAAAVATPFDTAIITLRKAGGPEPMIYLVLEFSKVFVTSFTINAGSGDTLPEETIEFSFQNSVRFRYQPQTSAGHGAANIKGWNKKDNVPM
jgi:type VI protein secretion system component Hcp